MELTGSPSDIMLLRALTPLDAMRTEILVALARKARRLRASTNRLLFAEGDQEKNTFYLLSGTVDLLQEGEVIATVHGGTSEAKHPLAHTLPRPCSAVATSPQIEYLQIDSTFLEAIVTRDQETVGYGVAELNGTGAGESDESDDWMTVLLRTKAFHKVPPANIQAIFMRMERSDYRAGDVVVKQGDDGDYFYVIVKGRCAVTRETPLNKDGIRLAELGMAETFGEESLISEAKRNATVTMLTDGTLMRLDKENFRTLLCEPLLHWIDYEQAEREVANGGQWLDVRLPSEFEQYHAEGAVNVPLHVLRLKMRTLDRNRNYIVYCDTGRRSATCAYILSERGFHAGVLRGGLEMTGMVRK